MSEREASNVVTSENLADFNAHKLGLAVADAPSEAESVETESEPQVEADEQSEHDAEKEAEVTDKPKNPKLEKRFSELTKQREAARQEAAKEREAREALEIRLKALETQNSPQPVYVNQEPQPSQFTDAFEYAKALAEFSAEKALADRDRQDAERKANEARDQVIQTWAKRLDAAKAELPDFEEMVQSTDVRVSDIVRDAILESDVGPRILYHLAENPEFANELTAMPIQKALRELGKLEAKFEKIEPEVKSKSVAARSKAPEPIKPLKSGNSGVDVKVDSNGQFHGTYQQWKAARQAGKIR
jgi:hypothetical protein